MKKRSFYGYATATDCLIARGAIIPPETVIINADQIDKADPSERPSYTDAINGQCRPPFQYTAIETIGANNIGDQVARVIIADYQTDTNMMIVSSFLLIRDLVTTAPFYFKVNMRDDMDKANGKPQLKNGDYHAVGYPDYFQQTISYDNLQEDVLFALLVFHIIHEGYEIEEVEFPRNYRRRHQAKQGKLPSNHYRIRSIKRTRKRYQPSGKTTGLKRPEHLVRGHFRHVENHPLQQFNGDWWIPAHNRGGNDSDKPKSKPIYRVEL